MLSVDIGSLVYLFFRMAPFFIVSFFALSSIFNQDFRGLVYLVGLVLAAVLCIIIGKVLPNPWTGKSIETRMKCSALTLGKTEPLSNLPLSQTVFGYTLAYLTYFVATNNLAAQNVPMFVFMSLIVIADMYWNAMNSCTDVKYLGLSLMIGGGIGVGWAVFIETNAPSVAYYSGIDKAQCTKPSKALYRCRPTQKPKTA
jgi:hypothetical protein